MPWPWRRGRGERASERRIRDLEREQAALEERCASVVGEVLERVVYVEIDYGGEPGWNFWPDFDSIDHGIELHTASGRAFSLFWEDSVSFVDYGMNVREGHVPVVEDTPRLDVTETSRWSSLVGRAVTACRVIWWPVDGAEGHRDPQTIRLDFGGDRVLVTAFETPDGATGHAGADHVTVFFGDAWERRSDLTADIHESLD
jgi:hypothetical protein